MNQQAKIVNAVTALQSSTSRREAKCIDNAVKNLQALTSVRGYATSIVSIYDSIYTIAKTLENTFGIKWTFCKIETLKQGDSSGQLTDYLLELQAALQSVFSPDSVATYAQKMAILQDCTTLRNEITRLEAEIKKAYCNTYPFYGETIPLNFKRGVLVRSVPDLQDDASNCSVLATNVFTLDHPNWYLKDVDRNVALVYTIPAVDCLIGLRSSGDSTSGLSNDDCSLATSLGCVLEELLNPDDSVVREILLSSCVKPRAVLIGGNESLSTTAEDFIKVNSNYDAIKHFSLTHGIPVFTLEPDKSVKERKSLSDPLCFNRSLK